MKNIFSVGEAARLAHTTAETLRHYDRIGLVCPGVRDAQTGYRGYTRQDIVRIQTVRALQQMDLSLQEIKEVLEYGDLEKIVDFLGKAERKADEKIAELQSGREKIRQVRADYEKKLAGRQEREGMYVKTMPERVILLSDTSEGPTLDSLWDYLRRFYVQLGPARRDEFAFEDAAGVYTSGNVSRLFAICTRSTAVEGIRVLPQGEYLCADCTEENRETVLDALQRAAREQYGAAPEFTVQLIVVSGILQWTYRIQVPLL